MDNKTTNIGYAPYIMESSKNYMVTYDIFSKMLHDRIVFLTEEVNFDSATQIQAQLLYLDSVSQDDITLYINSPGGCVDSGMMIYDTMRTIKSKVRTICTGCAFSMAAVILASGDKRSMLPNSVVMIHQASGYSGWNKTTDQLILTKQLVLANDKVIDILAKHTKKDRNVIKEDTVADKYMTAEEALAYGIIDQIIEHKK